MNRNRIIIAVVAVIVLAAVGVVVLSETEPPAPTSAKVELPKEPAAETAQPARPAQPVQPVASSESAEPAESTQPAKAEPKAAEPEAPQVAAKPKAAEVPRKAEPAAPAAAPEPVPPSFDVVRVERSGEAVIAGRAAPGSVVTLFAGTRSLGQVTADSRGQWVLVVDTPLSPGSHELSLESRGTEGRVLLSKNVVVVSVPRPQVAAAGEESHIAIGLILVILYVFYVCLFPGLRFRVSTTIGVVLVTAYLALGLSMDVPAQQLSYSTAMLVAAVMLSGLASYNFEFVLRTSFLETRLLNEIAERDGLTGLYNRRMFDDFMGRIWRHSQRENLPLEIV
ncbi:MAG: hypothetical protein IH786_10420, partial [Proteobacteria bacterium]|nr:hypothetical protein [Pseudomonadota bacterium]